MRQKEVVEMPQVKTGTLDEYRSAARGFMERHKFDVLMAFKGTLKCPPWAPPVPGLLGCRKCHQVHGDYYRVTIRRAGTNVIPLEQRKLLPQPHALSFDFWGTVHDRDVQRRVTAFDVLATIAAEAEVPSDPVAYLAELGLDPDNHNDYRRAIACSRFAARVQKFFSPAELNDLDETLNP